MSAFNQAISLAVLAALIGGLWISTISMRRRLRNALEGMEIDDWELNSKWYLTSATGEVIISGRRASIELTGAVQLVLRVAVECRGKHSVRVVPSTWITKLFPPKNSKLLPTGAVVIAKEEADRRFVEDFGRDESGEALFNSLFQDSSANLLWFGQSTLLAIFQRPARAALTAHGLQGILSRLLAIAQFIEIRASKAESMPAPPSA